MNEQIAELIKRRRLVELQNEYPQESKAAPLLICSAIFIIQNGKAIGKVRCLI